MAQLHCNFVSYSLGYGVDIMITLPSLSSCDIGGDKKPSHTLPHKYPVLYLLHGHGNDYLCWHRFTSMERLAEERRIAVVTCSVGNKAYMNAAYGENYFDFIAYELPEFIGANFPVSTKPQDSYVAGLSMGGYGAMVHGFTRPDAFAAIGAFSPGIRFGSGDLGHDFPETTDLYTLVGEALGRKAALPKLFLCCGQNDFLYQDVCNFHDMLLEKGLAHRWDDVPDFEHEWKFWDIELEAFLDWIPRSDPYAGMALHKL